MIQQELKCSKIDHKESRAFGRDWCLFGRLVSGRFFVFIVNSFVFGTYYGTFLNVDTVLPYITRWFGLDPYQLNGKVKFSFRTMSRIVAFLSNQKGFRP